MYLDFLQMKQRLPFWQLTYGHWVYVYDYGLAIVKKTFYFLHRTVWTLQILCFMVI